MCAAGESDDPRGADADRIVRVVERVREAGLDPRVLGAWRSWLSALASDAEAALAAAMAYSSLGDDARNAWLDALEADAAAVDVPKIALYAPLLAVEADAARRARMTEALSGGDDANAAFVGDFASDSSREGGASNRSGAPSRPIEALAGTTASGDSVCVILLPVYLDFVEMLVCRYHPDTGIVSAHHDPLRHASDAPRASEREVEEGVLLRPAPLRMVVEDLAHAVVADRREGRDAPPEVMRFSHLFVPDLDHDPTHEPMHDPARDPMRDSKPDADAP